jgi:hypothetical protein
MAKVRHKLPDIKTHEYNRTYEAVLEVLQELVTARERDAFLGKERPCGEQYNAVFHLRALTGAAPVGFAAVRGAGAKYGRPVGGGGGEASRIAKTPGGEGLLCPSDSGVTTTIRRENSATHIIRGQ